MERGLVACVVACVVVRRARMVGMVEMESATRGCRAAISHEARLLLYVYRGF